MSQKNGNANARASHNLSWTTLVAYVLPSLPLAAVGMPLVVHLPGFYASSEVGLNVAVAGAIFAFCRIADVFVDPVMGFFSDQLHTPFGRRRPLIAAGAPLLALGIWMVFVPGGHVGSFYLIFWLMLMYVGWSMTVIPHLSWGSELSADYHERTRIYGWSQASTVMGMVLVLVLPAVLEQMGISARATQVMAMAIFSIAALVPSVLLCLTVVPEPEVKLRTRVGLVPTLKFVLKNRAMRSVVLVDLVESLNQGARGAMFLYFANLALGLHRLANTLLLFYFVVGVFAIPFWMMLARVIGKHRALMAVYVFGICVSPLIYLIPAGNAGIAAVVLGVSGVTYGAPNFLIRSMMADVADADAYENNVERAGLMYSFLALTSKFGLGWAVFLAFGVLALFGFDPKVAHPPAAVIENFRIIFVAIPVTLAMISLFLVLGYPINEDEQRRIRAAIEKRRMEKAQDVESELIPVGRVVAEAQSPGTQSLSSKDALSRSGL